MKRGSYGWEKRKEQGDKEERGRNKGINWKEDIWESREDGTVKERRV